MVAGRFSWVPKPDLWPLCTVFTAAISTAIYSSYRALVQNPDVHVTAAHRHDGMHETGITLQRAREYYHSIFRKAHDMRCQGKEDVADTRIMRV